MKARSKGREAGFTLVEMSISLALLLVTLLIAAQILNETSQLFAEASGEALDAPVPLVIARIRADVVGSSGAIPISGEDGSLSMLAIQGTGRQIVYQKAGSSLFRRVVPLNGDPPEKPRLVWRGVTDWACRIDESNLVEIEVTYLRRTTPHSPLPTLPVNRGPVTETLKQRMYLLPRGAGLGDTW